MLENGGQGSLDWHVRELLKGKMLAGRLRCQHNSDSRRAHAGWPDWVVAGPAGILVWELKQEHLDATPAQQWWLDHFSQMGVPAGVRRPSDFLSGRMQRELFALAGLRVAQERASA